MVFEEGLTLSGARRRLAEDGETSDGSEESGAAILVREVVGDRVRDSLRDVKTGLQSILRLLAKDGVETAELELVPPSPVEKKKTVAKATKRK